MNMLGETVLKMCDFGESSRRLCRLFSEKEPSPDALAEWFDEIDYEALPHDAVFMAAILASRLDYSGVPKHLVSRVKGVLRYHQMLNTGLLAGLAHIIKLCNSASIPVTVVKGAAIKLTCAQEKNRLMWDVDIVVPANDYLRAVELAKKNGFEGKTWEHSSDLKRGAMEVVDIHRTYFKCAYTKELEGYKPESVPMSRYGADFSVPTPTELFLHVLYNAYYNLISFDGHIAPFRIAMEMHTFLEGEGIFNWDAVIALAKRLGVEAQVSVVLSAYDALIPGKIDCALLLKRLGTEKKLNSYAKLLDRFARVERDFHRPRAEFKTAAYFISRAKRLWCTNRAENIGRGLRGLMGFPVLLLRYFNISSVKNLPKRLRRSMQGYKKERIARG